MTKTVLRGNVISVALFENPNSDSWLEYHMPTAWAAELAFDELPESASRYQVQRYLSFCIYLEYVPTWREFVECNVQRTPDGDAAHVLTEMFDGDWVAVLFPDCPENVRPYLDAEAVYRDFVHLDTELEFPDAADPELTYVMARRPHEL